MTTNRIPVTTPYLAVRVTEGQETICLPQAHPRQQGPLTLGRELRLCQLYLRRALPVQRLNRAIPIAVEELRRQALALRGDWEDEVAYVRESVGHLIVNQPAPPAQSQIRKWATIARHNFRARSRAQLREAAKQESTADAIVAAMRAAGVDISSSGGDRSPPPGTREKASVTGGGTSTPGAASGSAIGAETTPSLEQYGIQKLRKQAQELKATWGNGDHYVDSQVAMRLARSVNTNPSDRLVNEWRYQARRTYRRRAPQRVARAAALEALAKEWEGRIASGAIVHGDPDEGTSSGTGAPQQAPGSERPTGRPAARRRGGPKKPPTDDIEAAVAAAVPAGISGLPAAELVGSLRGTVLGATVALPGLGEVPYIQLAIEKFRHDARALRSKWMNNEDYVRCRIADHMLHEKKRSPAPKDVHKWINAARRCYSDIGKMRAQEGADLLSVAENLEQRARAEGIMPRSSEEPSTHEAESPGHRPPPPTPGTSGGSPHEPPPARPGVTFAHLAIASLRRDAQQIREAWGRGEEFFVAQRVAERMVRQSDPSPAPATLQQWVYRLRSFYRERSAEQEKRVRQLEAHAFALEQELHSLISPASSQEPEPAADPESTGESPLPPWTHFDPAITPALSNTHHVVDTGHIEYLV
ncbi:hypothetical protein NCLIV_002020 [Neospora caninum Liverpool]|uniref:KRUF family protein n=1 Tax=Neospora caninum (strain Liverpool) TaxID=572307 RepID=F0V7M3_NEOCL|nr:hypothetical protein NCLIV_002020 [Neospora caninum Liverpool]CBZ49714.1 hypothetical protein NCLIV_002020 [Neospora caninum Liverpool]|eukprot:XP_003879749.1 hypothetical protein NCLIV_002020 [Neospora caninum Liverpool]